MFQMQQQNTIASAIMSGPQRVLGENGNFQFNDQGASASITQLGQLKNSLVVLNNKMVRGVDKSSYQPLLNKIVALLKDVPTDKVPQDMFVKLLVLTAYQRDIKDGKGERDIFYEMVFYLWEHFPQHVEVLLRSVIGTPIACWKDVLLMIEKLETNKPKTTSSQKLGTFGLRDRGFSWIDSDSDSDIGKDIEVLGETPSTTTHVVTESQKKLSQLLFDIMVSALKSDKALLDSGKNPETLVMKWTPRQQKHFDKNPLCLASRFAHSLFTGEHHQVMEKYRKMLSAGTQKLGTVEYFMCEGKWMLIDPAKVPAKALKTYRKAFLNQKLKSDGVRSTEPARVALAKKVLEFLTSGKQVHGANLMPHEIIQHLRTGRDLVLEAQLTNLVSEFVEKFPDNIGLVLAMCDVSSSMKCSIAGSKTQCVDVSIALSFLLSRLPGPFFDKILTFSADPVIIDLDDAPTFYDKIQKITKIWDGNSSSTDFFKAMKYILKSIVDNNIEPSSISDLTLVVFSDMQFDSACLGSSKNWDVTQERIEKIYKKIGFPVPKIVYWNLNSRSSMGHPAHAETKGVTMLSGFSQAALKTFLEGEFEQQEVEQQQEKANRDPYESLCKSLDKYIWLMEKFEQSGLFEGYVAPKNPETQE